jgi:succinyl-CoA synthetase beta subunit
MNLHEYQAKQLFFDYGIPVPQAKVASSPEQAAEIAAELGGSDWMVKAQVHAGGRGKAGGVKRVRSVEELKKTVSGLIGTHLVTHQTTHAGQPVNAVLVERPCAIDRELYLGVLVDRGKRQIAFMASVAGGMDIEEVAAKSPEKILTTFVNPIVGLQPYQCRTLAFGLGLDSGLIGPWTKLMLGLYRLFVEKDASLIEINPLVITKQGALMATDAKVNIDDNALFRQPAVSELRDASQEDEKEYKAQQFGLNYITLEGNIACMVNGAGLAMATMDLIKLEGGEPANFLDVGGGTTSQKVTEAFKLILSDKKVRAVLVNIFGGIVRCDLIAEGIIKAVEEVHVNIPVVVRLEGTNASQGREMLNNSGLSLVGENDLTQAARKAVELAKDE